MSQAFGNEKGDLVIRNLSEDTWHFVPLAETDNFLWTVWEWYEMYVSRFSSPPVPVLLSRDIWDENGEYESIQLHETELCLFAQSLLGDVTGELFMDSLGVLEWTAFEMDMEVAMQLMRLHYKTESWENQPVKGVW